MISIVIPLYNKASQIRQTLQSVFRQTFTDYEIVIVNDGSTDGSAEVVREIIHEKKSYASSPNSSFQTPPLAEPSPVPIRLIDQPNAGVSAARNRGITEAKGEYIALLDADDEWKSEYLATIADLIERYPEAEVFATNYTHVDSNGKEFPTILKRIKFKGQDGILDNYFEVAAHSNTPLWTSATVFSKKSFLNIGGFPVGIKSGEDLLTWARLACKYKIAYTLKPLAYFNVVGYKISEKPKRAPQVPDIVAYELLKLKKRYRLTGMTKYLSLWHKMRASIYLRLGKRSQSIRESLKALKYNPINYKLYIYILLNLSPYKLIK